MPNETLARRYASAIFQLAAERGETEVVGHELRTLAEAIEDNAATKEFFVSPVVERSEKERLLSSAVSGKTNEIALHALLLLVRKRREALLPEIVRQYGALELQSRGVEQLSIVSARRLGDAELGALVARLEKLYGKRFEATQRVDPNLIGGVRVLIGDRRIDGTVEGRLQELTRNLFARN